MKTDMTIRAILTDIEGTTTPISFVHEVLFPYARARLDAFCTAHAGAADVADALAEARKLEGRPDFDLGATIALLHRWMDEDKKAGPLKLIQGLIWREGYEAGELKGQVYKDAAEKLAAWHENGIRLYVYSSGSVEAQKLIFGFSDRGDLTPLFSGYFDTSTGGKLEPVSYRLIAKETGFAESEILFLSDHAGEIAAARDAGLHVTQIDRAILPDARIEDFEGTLVAGSFSGVSV